MVPMPPRSRWFADPRGHGRGLRVTAHPETGMVVLSLWRADECAATVRLTPEEAAGLVGALGAGLAELVGTAAEAEVTTDRAAGG